MSGLTRPSASANPGDIAGGGYGTGNVGSGNNIENIFANAINAKPNVLHKFASYNYIITLATLTKDQAASSKPLTTGELNNIISKTAGDWENGGRRASTMFGKFDYFIEDLIIETVYGFPASLGNSFATNINFKVVEPYSMGLFIDALQSSATASGYENYRESPFVICIEFKGWDDQGRAIVEESATRIIPIKLTNITFTVTQAGAVYDVSAMPYNEIAFTDAHSLSFRDVQISGETVQDLFNSFQKHIDLNLESIKTQLKLKDIDRYVVKVGAQFTDPQEFASSGKIWDSKVFHDYSAPGQKPFPDVGSVYDEIKNIYLTSKIPVDIKDKTFHFKQNAKIQDIMNEIIIRSEYIKSQIVDNKFAIDENGMINWWRIETSVKDLAYDARLNRPLREFTFRAVPYKVNVSTLLPPDAPTPATGNLAKNVMRLYNYIYTGKNTDIISFNIEYNLAFLTELASDLSNRPSSTSIGLSATAGSPDPVYSLYEKQITTAANAETRRVSTITANLPLSNNGYSGSGSDDKLTVQVKNLKKILENPYEMLEVNFEIIGDPYYVPSSGMGNQIGTPSSFNEMNDGSVNYQSGETDVLISFRTPIDLDLQTGLYKFDKNVGQFSGMYRLIDGESRFVQGKFTNTLRAFRRIFQSEATNDAPTPIQSTESDLLAPEQPYQPPAFGPR